MFDLARLTEFPKSLVSYFETEASIHNPPPGSMHFTLHKGKQYIDIYEAYLYAQDTVLPEIQKQGIEAYTAERLEQALKTIHGLMAGTLGKDHKFEAGEYSPVSDDAGQSIARWHPTLDAIPYIAKVLGTSELGAKQDEMIKNYSLGMENQFHVKAADLIEFFNVAKQFQKTMPAADSIGLRSQHVITQLASACFEGKLKPKEKSAIGKIVAFVDGRKIPDQMKVFLQETIELWNKCDRNNTEALSNLLAKTYYRFTDIHPFPNGNGRMGTLLLNMILRSMGHPAILLREPGDKENPNSSYSRAVDGLIAGDWGPMAKHIKLRLDKTHKLESPAEEQDDVLIETFAIMDMRLAHTLTEIQTSFPEFKLEAYFEKVWSKIFEKCTMNKTDEEVLLQRYDALSELLNELVKKHTELSLGSIKQTVARMSGYEAWDGAPAGEDVKCWRVMDSASEAQTLMDRLSQYDSLTLEKKDLVYPDETIPLFIIKSTIPDIIKAEKAILLRQEKQKTAHTLGPVFQA